MFAEHIFCMDISSVGVFLNLNSDTNLCSLLGDLGNLLLKKQPDFDSRCFGYPKLSVMFESLEDLYIIEKRAMERAQGFQIFVRRK